MDLRRLRAGEWITAAAGIALLVSLWSPWEPDQSGWEALGVIDILLALLAAGAVGLLLITAAQRVPAVPLAYSVFLTLAGFVATVLVLVKLVDTSGAKWGLWLALASTVGITAGSLIAMRDERHSKPGRHTDLAGAPAPEPPPVEVIPAPRLGSGG